MKVSIVCRDDQRDWILGKIATRLRDELAPQVAVSLGPEPDAGADLHHFVWYDDFRDGGRAATVGVTHIDSRPKLEKLRHQLRRAGAGVCMSRDHMEELRAAGLPRLCYVLPAHDGAIPPRRLHVGITTRLYPPDPCKREWLVEQLALHVDPADFRFSIMGAGWEPIVERLAARGFEVTHAPEFALEAYRALMPTLDFWLYTGWDEGSMGFLDALQAGVPTIATPQGFHLDVPGGLTHAFDDLASLVAVFESLAAAKRARTEAVRELTWARYARRHLEIWRHLLGVGPASSPDGPDGLASLVDPEPASPALAKAFFDRLDRTDRLRARLTREYAGERGVNP